MMRFALLAFVLVACGPGMAPLPDGSASDGSTAPGNDGGTCVPPTPANLCVMEGCDFPSVTLTRCSDGAEVSFYGESFCSARATLLLFVKNDCPACQQAVSSAEFQAAEYRARGLRTFVVYTGGPNGMTPTAANCGAWAPTAGVMLGTPVLDPRGVLARFTPQGTTPVAVVVNSRGSITALATDNGSGALPINVQSAYR